MSIFQAILLGIIQGLTEFLPVSSSGHLEIAHHLLGVDTENNLLFDVVVHGATVLSTIVVFRKDLYNLFSGLFMFKKNEQTIYIGKLLVSALPVTLVGILFRKQIELLFTENIVMVGFMLIFTAFLLFLAQFATSGNKKIGFRDAFIIGIAQTLAIIPGISRSGFTIATGLLLNNKRENVARFSFLMVLIPIMGANLLELSGGSLQSDKAVGLIPLIFGFIAAFLSGWLACKWMISIVKKGKLIYFSIYCIIVALFAIFAA